MASYPIARIKWLITKEGRGVATPNTITRQDKDNVIEIYSYRLCIGLRQAKGTWWVHPRDNSATTKDPNVRRRIISAKKRRLGRKLTIWASFVFLASATTALL